MNAGGGQCDAHLSQTIASGSSPALTKAGMRPESVKADAGRRDPRDPTGTSGIAVRNSRGTAWVELQGVLFHRMFVACPTTSISLRQCRWANLRGMSKQRIIVVTVLAGKSQREVADRYGVIQPRVSQLIASHRASGWGAVEPRSRRPRSNPRATPPEVVDRVLQLRQELLDYGADVDPASIHAPLQRHGRAPSPTTIWRILTRAGAITPQPGKRPQAHLPPVRRRPPQRVLAGRLRPLAAGHRSRRRGPALDRRPLPLPAVSHRPRPRHRHRRRGHLPHRLPTARNHAIHAHRQRHGVYHPTPSRPQRLRGRTARPGPTPSTTAPVHETEDDDNRQPKHKNVPGQPISMSRDITGWS